MKENIKLLRVKLKVQCIYFFSLSVKSYNTDRSLFDLVNF